MRYLTYIFWILIIIFGITFTSLNSHLVTINYYINSTQIYLPLLLLLGLAFGAVLGIAAVLPVFIKAKSANRKLKQRIKQVEQEVKNLRTIPIKDDH